MALILLKMNEIEAVRILISKANFYNKKQLSSERDESTPEITATNSSANIEQIKSQLDWSKIDANILKWDNKRYELLGRSELREYGDALVKSTQVELDDAGYSEAKCFIYLITALYE